MANRNDQDGDDGVTQVDVDALEKCPQVLDGLKSYIEQKLIPSMAKLHVSQKEMQGDHAITEVVFGGFDGGHEVGAKHEAYYQAVLASYRDIAKSLQDAADGTRQIVEKYKTAEERNRASAADIERIYAAGGTSVGTGGSSTSTADPAGAYN